MGDLAGNNSYDYQNEVRDVNEVFDLLRVSAPMFLSLVREGKKALATKHEFMEDSMSPTATTITGFGASDGDGVDLRVVSTVGIMVGSILRFTSALDATKTEQVKVSDVVSATQLTVVRDYGGTTGVTLIVGDNVLLISNPKGESTEASGGTSREPGMEYNYTEIFDVEAQISKTADAVRIYGMTNALEKQTEYKMIDLMRYVNNSILYGRRVARTDSEAGTLGGVLQFLENGNIDTTGGGISAAILNNILESIFQDGAVSDSLVILAAENQARKISALNTSGSNPQVQKAVDDRNLGGYISSFTGDLPIKDGFKATIVVEPNFVKDQIAILDMNSIELNYLRNFEDKDATPNGADFFRRRILGELSLTVKNGKKAHGMAVNLDI